jgi:hypothetical protein
MATPTIDATSTAAVWNNTASGTTTTGTMTVGATATLAVGLLGIGGHGTNNDNLITVGNVTFDGVTMTQLAGALKHAGTDADLWGFDDIYTLANPNTGASKLISNAATDATNLDGQLIAVTVIGSGLSVSFAGSSNGTAASTMSVSVTLTADEMLIGICTNGTSIPAVSGATTSLASAAGSNFSALAHWNVGYVTGVGTIALSFTTNSGDYSALTVVKVTSGGAAAFDPTTTQPRWDYSHSALRR